jgi:hypothetical protein
VLEGAAAGPLPDGRPEPLDLRPRYGLGRARDQVRSIPPQDVTEEQLGVLACSRDAGRFEPDRGLLDERADRLALLIQEFSAAKRR